MRLLSERKAFTMAEILIAITLIGILAALVIPRFTNQLEKGRAAEAINMLGAIRSGLEAYRNRYGEYIGEWNPVFGQCLDPDTWASLGLQDPHSNANRLFDYCPDIDNNFPAGSPAAHLVVIRAVLISDTNQYIGLNQSGVWSGTHAATPENADGGICNNGCYPDGTGCSGTDLPGPCA